MSETAMSVSALGSFGVGGVSVYNKALEAGASFTISASKKAIDMVVRYVRPSIRIDALLDPDVIRSTFDAGRAAGIDAETLIRIAANSVSTVALARALYDEIAEDLRRQTATVGDQPESDVARRAVAALEAWTSEAHPIHGLLLAVEAAGREDVAEVERRVRRGELPDNPVIAQVMWRRLRIAGAPESERREWVERALAYWPLDAELLGELRTLVAPGERAILDQILSLRW